MTDLYLRYIWLYSILVKLGGDVEENLGPEPKPCQSFSICQFVFSICQFVSAHNFKKVSLRAYISVHKFDGFAYLRLNSDTAFDDDN